MELVRGQASRPVVARVHEHRQTVVRDRQFYERDTVLSREFALGVFDRSRSVGDYGLASHELLEATARAGDADRDLDLRVFLAEVFSSGYRHGVDRGRTIDDDLPGERTGLCSLTPDCRTCGGGWCRGFARRRGCTGNRGFALYSRSGLCGRVRRSGCGGLFGLRRRLRRGRGPRGRGLLWRLVIAAASDHYDRHQHADDKQALSARQVPSKLILHRVSGLLIPIRFSTFRSTQLRTPEESRCITFVTYFLQIRRVPRQN